MYIYFKRGTPIRPIDLIIPPTLCPSSPNNRMNLPFVLPAYTVGTLRPNKADYILPQYMIAAYAHSWMASWPSPPGQKPEPYDDIPSTEVRGIVGRKTAARKIENARSALPAVVYADLLVAHIFFAGWILRIHIIIPAGPIFRLSHVCESPTS